MPRSNLHMHACMHVRTQGWSSHTKLQVSAWNAILPGHNAFILGRPGEGRTAAMYVS